MPVPQLQVLTNAGGRVRLMSVMPALPYTPAALASPDPYTNFCGLTDNNTWIPPTAQGAVGPSNIMTMANTEVRIQTRGGAEISRILLQAFWSSTNIGAFSNVFDPQLEYDPCGHRWVGSAAVDGASTNSGVLIGVSLTSDPTRGWNLRRVKADINSIRWADHPQLGFNKDWLVLQANMYTNSSGGFYGSHIWVFNKTNLYAGGFSAPKLFVRAFAAPVWGESEKPVSTYDANFDKVYLVQSVNGNYSATGWLRLLSISGPVGSEVLNNAGPTNYEYYTINQTWGPWPAGQANFAPQTNSTKKIHCADDRFQSAVYRNGYIWCAQTAFLPAANPTRTAAQWWVIRPGSGSVFFGGVDEPNGNVFYAYPSIAVNRFNDVLPGYSSFSATQYASASYSFHAFFDDIKTFRSPVTFHAGEGVYFRAQNPTNAQVRWGDESCSVVDGLNDADLWTLQEYAATPVGNVTNCTSGRWGLWWAQVKVPVSPNDKFTNSTQLSGLLVTVTNSFIRTAQEAGEPSPIADNEEYGSVWFRWTAPVTGSVSISTYGSAFTPALAVYTGSALTNLVEKAELGFPGEGSGDGGSGSPGWRPGRIQENSPSAPKLRFQAIAGTNYYIAVAAEATWHGDVILTLDEPTAPLFTRQPVGGDVIIGYSVPLSAEVIGSPTPSLQWRFNGTNIAGATGTNYTFQPTSTNQTGIYTLLAWNTYGTNLSDEAYVKVWASGATPLSGCVYTNNQFQFHQTDVTNYYYIVLATTNIGSTNWVSIQTNRVPYTFTDPLATNYPQRFFRTLFVP